MACSAIAHNKVMIIDQALVITGGFNFTKQYIGVTSRRAVAQTDFVLRQYFGKLSRALSTNGKSL
jgi:hypothetical protein